MHHDRQALFCHTFQKLNVTIWFTELELLIRDARTESRSKTMATLILLMVFLILFLVFYVLPDPSIHPFTHSLQST